MADLFEYNEGLPSRFPVVLIFDDFSDGQLLEVFDRLVTTSKFKYDGNNPKFARIATRELGKLRGTKVFTK